MAESDGWFVVNARDVTWIQSEERGQDTDFEGRQEWTQLGFRIQVLSPGQRGLYHGERGQEDFLVVSGECVLVIEGEERRLKAWDFVHCPPWTKHTFVGAGDGPCAIVMTGSRVGGFDVVYAVNEVAAKHGASVLEETSKPDEAYARVRAGGALGVPRGVASVSGEPSVPPGYGTVTPWIISPDSAALIRFLEAAFDAEEIPGSRMLGEDGSIAHVEVRIGSSIVMLFDSYEGWPETPAFFRLYVGDADATFEQALAAGASSVTRVTELFWGDRVGRVRDPFGNIWWLQSRATDVPAEQLQKRMQDPAMLEAMSYVQQSLVDALRTEGEES